MPSTTKNKSPLSKRVGSLKKKPTEPFWKGPEVDGITQSMLGNFLSCRERFRIRVVEGIGKAKGFVKAIEYGNMWHICEEHLALGQDWVNPLKVYAMKLSTRYRESSVEVDKWFNICLRQFPHYVAYWKKHLDVVHRKPFLSEENFRILYELPSGRVVTLRGKIDSADEVGKGKTPKIWLQENKTKGDIREDIIETLLMFDIQTGFYMTALEQYLIMEGKGRERQLAGVRYNVIRRPLSGGKGSIRQREATAGSKCSLKSCKVTPFRGCPKCKGTGRFGGKPAETAESFYGRLEQYFRDEPEGFFMRWNVPFAPEDIEKYKIRFLNPALEQLCDWWEFMLAVYGEGGTGNPFDGLCKNHWQHPYGVYNVMDQGGMTDMDEYVMTGNRVGLERIKTLYPELEED